MFTRRALTKMMAVTTAIGGAIGPAGVFAQTGSTAPERLAIKGYDPVAYFTLSKPTPGIAEYELFWDGARYRFANAQHRDLFLANPEKYAPQFGGSCAMNMANGNRRESDPSIWLIANGHLYVFAGQAGSERFRLDAKANAAKAATNWRAQKATQMQ